MPQITDIHIKGFQAHVDSRLKLGPGLNVITGPSDAGKTAIIRAVRWVAFNEPTGEAFVNERVGGAEVTLTLDNGIEIRKKRRKGKTAYALGIPGRDPQVFEMASVPEEVEQALGIVKTSFGDYETALNFAFQLEAPFLISEPGSTGAKVLGKLAGTEIVDLATKSVSKDTHAARQEKSAAVKEIGRINTNLGEFLDLDKQKEQLELSQDLLARIDETVSKQERLIKTENKLTGATENIAELQKLLEMLEVVPVLGTELQSIEKGNGLYNKLASLQQKYAQLVYRIDAFKDRVAEYLSLEEAEVVLDTLTRCKDRMDRLNTLCNRMGVAELAINDHRNVLNELEEVTLAEEVLNAVGINQERLERLQELIDRYDLSAKKAATALYTVESAKGIAEAENTLARIAENEDRLKRLKSLRIDVSYANNSLASVKNEVIRATAALKSWQQELTKVWAEAGDVCPLCEQTVKGVS